MIVFIKGNIIHSMEKPIGYTLYTIDKLNII